MRRILAPVLLLVLALPLFSASRETHTVEVVQVPVFVTRDGASVSGLTRDNFELYVNGKARPFEYFDVYDFGAAPPAAQAQTQAQGEIAAPRDVRQRRLYVLLFDLVYSTPKAIARARVAADSYMNNAGPADAFAVGKYTVNHGIELFVPFTRDRQAVRNAIQRMSEGGKDDPLHLALAPVERAEIAESDKFAESGQVQQMIADSAAAQILIDPARRRIRDQLEALGDLADRLAPLEGNRHVVLLTSGFNSTSVHGIGPANTIVSPVNFGANGQLNKPVRQGTAIMPSDPATTGAMREMYGRFTRAGVFLDCIDVEGARLGFSGTHDSEGLSMLARDTGGQVVLNHNDLRQAMQTLTDMQRVVYVLGFHTEDTGKRDNKIEVKLRGVEGRGIRTNYRPSYSTTQPKASTVDALRVADILENDIPQTGVTTTIAVSGNRVDVEVPARELLALSGKPNASAEAMLYVFSGHGVVAYKGKRISLDAAQANAAKPVHVIETFDELPPGHYEAKVLLRVEGTDALGFARAPMTVE
jgi:VWFA-related protein